MGIGEEVTMAMSSKATVSIQETSNIPSHPDQETSTQAYYGAGATQSPFFTSAVASPSPHPYLWGNQDSKILLYGSPLPYSTVYPHGGLYAHTNMGATFSITKTEEIVADRKDSESVKIPKGIPGNVGLIGGKSGQIRKAALGSGCDANSQSAESGSRSSSDASNEDANQLATTAITKKSFSQMLADVSAPGNPDVPVPTTNLNNEMDSWNAFSAGAAPRPTLSSVSYQVPSVTMVGHEGILHDHQLIQDERELKRLRRKQSNRESARRSKLRKQVECEELQAKVEKMSDENHTLTGELNRLAKECEKLTSENDNIMEELTQTYRCGVISNLHVNSLDSHSANGEENSHGQNTWTGSYSNFASLQPGNFIKSNGKFAS